MTCGNRNIPALQNPVQGTNKCPPHWRTCFACGQPCPIKPATLTGSGTHSGQQQVTGCRACRLGSIAQPCMVTGIQPDDRRR